MQYLKNSDLADMHHVSERTVNNWIAAAREGRLDLKLYQHAEKFYIANTPKNLAALDTLVRQRRKYLNTKAHKVVTPKPEFYKLYSREQIFDIIESIDIHRETPLQYNYFNGGADFWDRYVQSLAKEDLVNSFTGTVQLLDINANYLDMLLSRYKRVNVVDVGVGNAMPVRNLLSRLLESGKLGKYIGIDIAEEMLDIAEHNIKKWFEGAIHFERHIRDITYQRFKDVLVEESLENTADSESVNLVLFFGGTAVNFRFPDDALRVLYNSMRRNDILIYARKLDSPTSRRYFSLDTEINSKPLSLQDTFMLDLLNIDPEHYEPELFFDEVLKARFIYVRLKKSLTIDFAFENGSQHINLNKGEALLLWRAFHQTAPEVNDQLYRNGFNILHTSQTPDHEYMLAIADIKGETQ